METALRAIEVVVYCLLRFLPFLWFALYPFQDRLRYRKAVTIGMVTVLCGLEAATGIFIVFYPGNLSNVLSLMSTALYAAFYISAVQAPIGKSIFTLLILSNLSNFVVIASKCLEGQLFPELAVQRYRWSYSVTMAIILSALAVPMYLFFKHTYNSMMQKENDTASWKYLWTIPAVFYTIWYYGLYCAKEQTPLEIALRPDSTLLFAIVNTGAFVVYYVIGQLIAQRRKAEALEIENTNLSIQASQYTNLNSRIEEARQLRHDVRHHIATMKDYLLRQDYDSLLTYLNDYDASIPNRSVLFFCKNATANTLLTHFAYDAMANGIDFDVEVQIPENTFMSPPDLSVLFGNLIENALAACMKDPAADRCIRIRASATESAFCLTVDNTFHGETLQTEDGAFLSTKHDGVGIGIRSVRSIANRYNGFAKFEQKQGMFQASVLLNNINE